MKTVIKSSMRLYFGTLEIIEKYFKSHQGTMNWTFTPSLFITETCCAIVCAHLCKCMCSDRCYCSDVRHGIGAPECHGWSGHAVLHPHAAPLCLCLWAAGHPEHLLHSDMSSGNSPVCESRCWRCHNSLSRWPMGQCHLTDPDKTLVC